MNSFWWLHFGLDGVAPGGDPVFPRPRIPRRRRAAHVAIFRSWRNRRKRRPNVVVRGPVVSGLRLSRFDFLGGQRIEEKVEDSQLGPLHSRAKKVVLVATKQVQIL